MHTLSNTPSEAGAGEMSAYQQIDSRPLTGRQKNLIALVVVGNLAEFFDMFLIGFVVALLTTPWNLTGFQAGTILACSGLGTVAGAIFWGRMADRIGRRAAFSWCVSLFVGFTALTLATPEGGWVMLAVLRIGVGMGVGGLNITSIPYVQEFVPARQRGFLAGLGSAFIPLGLFLGSLAQKMVGDNWRALIMLGCIPVFLLAWVRMVPESPRYYQVHGHSDKARESLAWALDLPLDQVGYLPPLPESTPASYSLLIRRYRRPLAVVASGTFCFVLGGVAVQSWGQTLLADGYGLGPQRVAVLFMWVSLADLIGRLASAFLADRIGRRATMFSFGMLGALGCAITAAAGDRPGQFFAGIVIIMMFGDGAFGILNAFGAEQFPSAVRSTGIGLGYGIGASAKVIGPAVMGAIIGGSVIAQDVTMAVIPPVFTFFGVCFALGAITYLFARETRGADLDAL